MSKAPVSNVDTVQAMGELLDAAARLADDAAPVLDAAGHSELAERCRAVRDGYEALVYGADI